MYACDEGSACCNCMYAKLKTNTGPHGLLNRQGIACNECMQCTMEMDVCKTMHRQWP